VFVVGRPEVEPLIHLHFRTDATFDWGRCSDGALELTFALPSHAASSDPQPVCRAFCEEVVGDLRPEGFVLAHGQIALWLLAAVGEACSGRRSRWSSWIRHAFRGRMSMVSSAPQPTARLTDFVPEDPDRAGCLIEVEGLQGRDRLARGSARHTKKAIGDGRLLRQVGGEA
jgi:hypothetical protein